MSDEPKVLTGLLERRAIEAEFEELGRTADPELRLLRAEAIAKRGELALAGLLALLDTPDPALRGRLGLVATLLPREQIVPALQAVVRSGARSDQERVAAASLLARFLGESADETVLAPLADPDAAALQSLRELVFAMDRDPLALLEFMQQLAQQPPEVSAMLVDACTGAPASPHIATFLRVLSQDEHVDLARRAIEQLGRIRTPDAAHALQTLTAVLPPAAAGAAERSLRKLRFSGVAAGEEDLASPWSGAGLDWRLLVSPVDADGMQFVWFVGERSSGRAVFLTYLLKDPGGVASAAVALDMPRRSIPRRVPPGSLLSVDVAGGEAPILTLLEAPVEEGVSLMRAALDRHREDGTVPPLAFRLLNPIILDLPGAVHASDEPLSHVSVGPNDYALLHSTMLPGWFAVESLALAQGKPAGRVFSPPVCASYSRRLHTMARWLKMAGEADGAARVRALAVHLSEVPAPESPFIQHLSESLADSQEHGKE